MYCTRCGMKLKDGNAFCTECGAPIEPNSAPAQPADNSGQQTDQQPQSPRGRRRIPVIVGCGVVIVALIVALVVALPQLTSNDPDAGSAQESAATQSSNAGNKASTTTKSGSTSNKTSTTTQNDDTDNETSSQSSSATRQSSSSSSCAFNNATVTASSELPHDSSVNTSYYYASNVLDDDPDTCWAEGASGNGAGESLTFTLNSAAKVSGFKIRNGYQKTEELYKYNARPHELKIYADGDLIDTATLVDDGSGYQTVEFDQTFKATTITIEIDSVYEGTKWSDCVISDIRFFS